jgi:hypothetical protein
MIRQRRILRRMTHDDGLDGGDPSSALTNQRCGGFTDRNLPWR